MRGKSGLVDSQTRKPFARVAVFRALQLGDLLCSIPALRALRGAMPEAHITLIGLKWAREFTELYSRYIDDFIEFPGFPGFPEREPDVRAFPKFLEDVQSRSFDLCVQMQGSGLQSNSLVALFGARHLAGYFVPGQFCPDPDRFLPHRAIEHEVWRYLALVEHLGAPASGDELDYFVTDEAMRDLESLEGVRELLAKPFICLHPGAREAFRCWSLEGFAKVGRGLAELGFGLCVTGSASERELGRELSSRLAPEGAIDLTGRTGLKALGALISRSRMLICNDTGVSHLAVALKKPSVVVFTRSEFLGWPPLNRTRHRVVSRRAEPEARDVFLEARDLIEKEGLLHAPTQDSHLARSRQLPLLSEPRAL